MTTDPRIDAFITKAAPFAQPILKHLRALTHSAVPDLTEAIKWGMPHFVYKGKNLAGMAAFKAHVAFVLHVEGRQGVEDKSGMGQYGKIRSLADLPGDAELIARLLDGKDQIDNPVPVKKAKPAPKPEIAMPDDFAAALAAMQGARDRFDGFAPGQRREYLEWITTAKAEATRAKRIAQACEWIAEGKTRNWKYQNC
jgi:uncharacterized protein YdeI (YjbR/CyaY-like superfamily)